MYFHEQSLHDSGAVERAIARLTEMGNTYQADGALWLRTEQFGDDKDRVLIKSNGNPAYISGDCAYYLDKRERGFDLCVIMLGADHHGYVGRLMAMCQAFGDKPHENLEVLIGQMVNLVSDGQPLRMAKRAGTVITIDDLIDAVGCRRRSLRPGPLLQRLDDRPRPRRLDRAVQRQPRLLRAVRPRPALLDPAQRRRPRHRRRPLGAEFDPALLSHEREGDLLRALAEFPRGRRVGGGAARAAPAGPLPRGDGGDVPQVLRRVPGAAAR